MVCSLSENCRFDLKKKICHSLTLSPTCWGLVKSSSSRCLCCILPTTAAALIIFLELYFCKTSGTIHSQMHSPCFIRWENLIIWQPGSPSAPATHLDRLQVGVLEAVEIMANHIRHFNLLVLTWSINHPPTAVLHVSLP